MCLSARTRRGPLAAAVSADLLIARGGPAPLRAEGRVRADVRRAGSARRAEVRATGLQVQAADAELVKAHVVGELVAHGAHDLLAKLLWVVAVVPAKGVAEDDDAVVRAIARGPIALVHAIGALAPASVGDHDGYVA